MQYKKGAVMIITAPFLYNLLLELSRNDLDRLIGEFFHVYFSLRSVNRFKLKYTWKNSPINRSRSLRDNSKSKLYKKGAVMIITAPFLYCIFLLQFHFK